MLKKIVLQGHFSACITTNGGTQNGSSVGICYMLHTRFCTFGADLRAQTVPINKISTSELSRKFVKRVHCWSGAQVEDEAPISSQVHADVVEQHSATTQQREFPLPLFSREERGD